jgi:hypothetical protein
MTHRCRRAYDHRIRDPATWSKLITEHNETMPHSAFEGQTPDEAYFARGAHVPDELAARRHAARQEGVCATAPQLARRVHAPHRYPTTGLPHDILTFNDQRCWTHLHHGSSRMFDVAAVLFISTRPFPRVADAPSNKNALTVLLLIRRARRIEQARVRAKV